MAPDSRRTGRRLGRAVLCEVDSVPIHQVGSRGVRCGPRSGSDDSRFFLPGDPVELVQVLTLLQRIEVVAVGVLVDLQWTG